MTAPPRKLPAPVGSRGTRDAETLAGLIDPTVDDRVRRVLRHLSAKGLRLATAESCTGGLLASLFTDIQGVSHVFERGLVVYDEVCKQDLLGVPPELIQTHGVVSREVAVAMAEGLLAGSHADVGVAVTGFADKGVEPGLVHIAIARTGQPTLHRARRFGTVGRGAVRLGTVRAALQMLEEM